MLRLQSYLVALIILFTLAACGGGSNSNSISNSNDSTPPSGSTVNASYSKGPVSGAEATLLDADGNIIAGPVTTAADGSASFESVMYVGLVYASFAGGNYVDEATGTRITLAADFVMRSGVIDNAGSGSLDLVATPLTEIAFQRAQDAALSLDIDLTTVDFYIDRVADEYGLDGINLAATPPTALADITGTSDGDLYGAVLAAISQQLLDAGVAPGGTALARYIADNVEETDVEAFTTAVTGLTSNSNSSAFISETIANAVNSAAGAASVDTTPPVLTLLGDNPLIVEINTDITSALLLFSAIDDVNGDLNNRVVINVDVDTATVGEYSVLYRVADLSGNNASATRIVEVVDTAGADTTKPVITLVGANTQSVVVGDIYVESGATATDNVDGDISVDIVIDNSSVDTSVIDSYTVTYNVADVAGNSADTVTRVVNVVASGSDVTAPGAVITFPTASSATDADTVTIRGTATDDSTIAVVRVNGVDVQTEDDYAHWQATINLAAGNNTLSVETTDVARNTNLNAASVHIRSEPAFEIGSLKVLDSANNRVLLVDYYRQAVLAVDLATGMRSILSDATTPNSVNPIADIIDIVLDTSNNRALVFNASGILAINLDSGARTLISEFSEDAAPRFVNRRAIELDSARNRILLADANRIIQVNLSTGARTVLSDSGIPDRLNAFSAVTDMVMDSTNNRLLVLDAVTSNNRLIAVTLSTDATDGTRSIISDKDFPAEGVSSSFITGLALDSDNQRVLSLGTDSITKKIMAIDLEDGSRRSLHDLAYLNDVVVGRVSILLDNAGDRVLMFEYSNSALTAVDLAAGPDSGDITVISSNSFPQEKIVRIQKFPKAIDISNYDLFQFDAIEKSLLAVDLTTGVTRVVSTDPVPYVPSNLVVDGDRALISMITDLAQPSELQALDLGTGTISPFSTSEVPDTINAFAGAGDIELDRDNDRAFVLDSRTSVVEVSLIDGARSILSDEDTPDSANIFSGFNMALDSGNNRLLVADSVVSQVVAVSLSDGARTIFSNNSAPSEVNPFRRITAIALDSNNNQALVVGVVDEGSGPPVFSGPVVFAFSLSDGARTVLSSNNTLNRLSDPSVIEVDSINNRALIVDGRKVVAIDLVNGHRVVVYE